MVCARTETLRSPAGKRARQTGHELVAITAAATAARSVRCWLPAAAAAPPPVQGHKARCTVALIAKPIGEICKKGHFQDLSWPRAHRMADDLLICNDEGLRDGGDAGRREEAQRRVTPASHQDRVPR